jgi:glycosyltransferase involved in cell wall biosynthesis
MNRVTCIVVPAYNEASSINYVLDSIQKANLEADVLVVNDGSTDETSSLAKLQNVFCISHPVNCGVGAAVITGFHWAISKGYQQIVVMDADGQHPAESIHALLSHLGEFDIVVGARNWKTFSSGFLRRTAHNVLSAILRIRFGINVGDVTSGFRAFRSEAVQSLLPKLGDQYLEDTVMLLVEAANENLSVGQIPVLISARYSGNPSHGLVLSGVRYFGVIIRVLVHNKDRKIQ